MKSTITCALLALALLAFVPAAGLAQEKTLEERVAALEKRIAELEAKLAEAEARELRGQTEDLLKSLRDQVRVEFAKNGRAPARVKTRWMSDEDLRSDTHQVRDAVLKFKGSTTKAALLAEPKEGHKRFALLDFLWASGVGELVWYDDLDAIKAAHPTLAIDEKPAEGAVDPWAAYKKVGRYWIYELRGGMTLKYEITEVTDKWAMLSTSFTMNGQGMGEPTETKIEFNVGEGGGVWDGPEPLRQSVNCKAGEFDCISYDDGVTWMMAKYPGIIVKSEHMELIEFNE